MCVGGPALVGQVSDSHVRIDQFGYRSGARKTVILRQAVVGWDAPDSFSPGGTVEIRRPDSSVAFSAPVTSWNGGNVHADSGDRVWWCDFTGLTEDGLFVAVDLASGASSEPFMVGDSVYDEVHDQAVRMYYYQRCGLSKSVPFASANWTDSACHLGPDQDTECLSVVNPVPATSRDLSGGWHDAGNYSKYVNFTDEAVHPLLSAYLARPATWGDDTTIPESGNGAPDILDEVAYELRWLLAMQESDGSVLHKKGVTGFQGASPPSADTAPRRYAPPTASATISAAGALAHGARVFQGVPGAANAAFAQQLLDGAELAWSWLEANPSAIPSAYDNAGFADVSAEDPADWQQMNRLRAAVHLFGATLDTTYRDWFDANVASAHLLQWQFALVWEQPINEALLEYGEIPGATASVAANIRSIFAASVASGAHLGQVIAGTDAYRAWLSAADTGWGSNRTRCLEALMFVNMNRYGLDGANAALYDGGRRRHRARDARRESPRPHLPHQHGRLRRRIECERDVSSLVRARHRLGQRGDEPVRPGPRHPHRRAQPRLRPGPELHRPRPRASPGTAAAQELPRLEHELPGELMGGDRVSHSLSGCVRTAVVLVHE